MSMNDHVERRNGDATERQGRPTRIMGDRHPVVASCRLTPSFPQAQTPFQTLNAMSNPALLRGAAVFNARTSAVSGASMTNPWVAHISETEAAIITRVEPFNRGYEVSYTTKKRSIDEVPKLLSTSSDEGETCSSVATAEKPKRKRKYRKATHTLDIKTQD
ncbi:hypothetical protein GN244_ATG02154 [Phytophthora infestans]|nr:hypothetical protein GN244_ATG02154 [Phytophthora infestans]KAF4139281.1 hypothetical protein GN958_ATG11497 [Phytophthora infestans]